MNSFTDYYTLLGIDADASPEAVKAAFKKLALRYHPDVYKGEDAHERMRLLLLAYQTLNDPVARRQYDAMRAEHLPNARVPRIAAMQRAEAAQRGGSVVSPSARRDRQRYYDFPDFRAGQPVQIDLIDMAYTLTPAQAETLWQRGLLRGIAAENGEGYYFCHRCHHRWKRAQSMGNRSAKKELPRFCPRCHALDWPQYLLLRCVHCSAVFESEQIRYEIGNYSYGGEKIGGNAALCPPYELFPLCPYCGTARWCPAEDERVNELRRRAKQRAAFMRVVWIGIVVVVVLVGIVALGVLR